MTFRAISHRPLDLVVASLCIPIAVFNVVSQAFVPEPWTYFYGLGGVTAGTVPRA